MTRPENAARGRTFAVDLVRQTARLRFAPWRDHGGHDDTAVARTWLSGRGVTPAGAGSWTGLDPWGTPVRTATDVAHAWTSHALADPGLDATGRLRLALSLLALLDDYWVACEIGWRIRHTREHGLREQFWAGYRRYLEAPDPPEAVRYSLCVDWFSDRVTAPVALDEMLGNDADALIAGYADGRVHPDDPASVGPHRRAERVLGDSGPVPWAVKAPLYRRLSTVEWLHGALLRGVLGSYHDPNGDLDPVGALELVRGLALPAGTPHLAALTAALSAGTGNHHRNPTAWNVAVGAAAPAMRTATA